MAYTPLTPVDLVAGKPTKEEIFTLIRSNQESFNTDIEALKQTAITELFNIKYAGDISNYTNDEIDSRIPVFKASVDATIVTFTMTLLEASTSGTLEVEIDKSTDDGVNWTPLLNNPVTITTSTVGSVSGSVDWVSVPLQSFLQGDLLRLRITGLQVDQGAFHVLVYGELG